VFDRSTAAVEHLRIFFSTPSCSLLGVLLRFIRYSARSVERYVERCANGYPGRLALKDFLLRRCSMSVAPITAPGPLLVSLRIAAKMLGLSERTVWAMADDGRLPSIRCGRRRLFSVATLESWIASQESVSAATGN
jgi:excisionase family DNA binding protein